MCQFYFAVVNRVWFIGDQLIGKAHEFLTQHRDRFPQLADYDGFNNLQYLPELIVMNVGSSDFTRYSNSQQWANIRKMVITCKALTKKVVRQTDNFRGLFLNLMVSLPWYVGWKSQRLHAEPDHILMDVLPALLGIGGAILYAMMELQLPLAKGSLTTITQVICHNSALVCS